MRIKIEADTEDVEAGLRRTQSEIQRLQVQAARSARTAERVNLVGSVVRTGIVAGTAYSVLRGNNAMGNAFRGVAGRLGLGALAGRAISGGGRLGMAGPAAAAAAGTFLVTKSLARIQEDQLEETRKQTDTLGRVANAAEASASIAGNLLKTSLIAGTGYSIATGKQNPVVAGGRLAARTLAGRVAMSQFGTTAGGAITSTLMRLAPALAAIAAGYLVFRAIDRNINRILAETAEQSKSLAKMTRAAILSEKSLADVAAAQMRERDPFARSVDFQRRRVAMLALAPTRGEVASLGVLQSSIADRADTSNAADRARGAVFAPYMTQYNRLRTNMNWARQQWWRGQLDMGEMGGGQDAETSRWARRALNMSLGLPGQLLNADATIRRGLNWWQGGEGAIEEGRAAQQAMMDRRYSLMQLERRGPGATLDIPGTVRAGGTEEYAFRVQQERRGLMRQATVKWQDDVLEVLRQMLKQQEISVDAYNQRLIAYGREPIPVE